MVIRLALLIFFVGLSGLTAMLAFRADHSREMRLTDTDSPVKRIRWGMVIGCILVALYAYICWRMLSIGSAGYIA